MRCVVMVADGLGAACPAITSFGLRFIRQNPEARIPWDSVWAPLANAASLQHLVFFKKKTRIDVLPGRGHGRLRWRWGAATAEELGGPRVRPRRGQGPVATAAGATDGTHQGGSVRQFVVSQVSQLVVSQLVS